MSERGRDLFERFILELSAEAEDWNIALEAAVAGLRAATVASSVHVQEIEEEVGRIGNALNAALERERQNAYGT